jgi:alpha-tubulin suppressor-like RCC1 family protein
MCARLVSGLGGCLFAIGCVSSPIYECSGPSQCISSSGEQGLCMPTGSCAYADESCGPLGFRYSRQSVPDLASSCASETQSDGCLVQVAAGIEFSCAVKSDGSAWCWGNNDHGQMGDGAFIGESRAVPVKVALPAEVQVASVGCGEVHACALSKAGSVWCWGGGDSLQLGLGSQDATDHVSPVEMVFPETALPIRRMSVGAAHTCVVDNRDKVWCWGENDHEECGQPLLAACPGTTEPAECEDVPVPTLVADADLTVKFVVSGDEFTCSIDDLNELACWGDNSLAELGIGTLDVAGGANPRQSPVPVQSGRGSFLTLDTESGIPLFAAGAEHACAVVGGSLLCWGSNGSGQVGTGRKTASEVTPVFVTSSRNVAIGCMAKHTCAIAGSNAALSCWGNNSDGQLGVGSTEDVLAPIPGGLVGVREAGLGDRHTCAIVAGGSLYCWGANDKGQLGNANLASVLSPLPSEAQQTICE